MMVIVCALTAEREQGGAGICGVAQRLRRRLVDWRQKADSSGLRRLATMIREIHDDSGCVVRVPLYDSPVPARQEANLVDLGTWGEL